MKCHGDSEPFGFVPSEHELALLCLPKLLAEDDATLPEKETGATLVKENPLSVT